MASRGQIISWVSWPAALVGVVRHPEPLSAHVVWEPVLTLAHSRKAGLLHFASANGDPRKLWPEFANYVRQADVYFSSAQSVPGTSSALLYYYAALQLAKAELIASIPAQIVGKAIGHGLSHSITSAGHPRNDFLAVRSGGIFPLLYEKRTGVVLPAGTKLRIPALLEYVPEIGEELRSATPLTTKLVPLYHAIALDGPTWWSTILTPEPGFLEKPRLPATKRFLNSYELTVAMRDWKSIFGVSNRVNFSTTRIYQEKLTRPVANNGDIDTNALLSAIGGFANLLDNTIYGNADAFLATTLPGTDLPMTPSLARYALMYYLSSLVRYKPVILDPNKYHDYVWVLESFANASGLPLIVSAVDAISGKWHTYGNGGRS